MVLLSAMLCSQAQPESLLIYLYLEQKQGRQRKAARTPTRHMLFLMIENTGCARRSPNTFLRPGACGTTAVVLLFPPVFSPLPPKSAAGKLRMLLLWYTFGRRLFCEDAIATTSSPWVTQPSAGASWQEMWLRFGNFGVFQASGIKYFCSHSRGRIHCVFQIWGWSQCTAAFAHRHTAR